MPRKTLKCNESTKERFDDLKRSGETTNGFLNRAMDALEADEADDQHPGAPRCTNCGNKAHVWTVEDGMLVCDLCANGDIELET